MRTVYLGTSPFAAVVLRRLHESPHRPVLVVTRPDRPQGRGRRLHPPPVAETASELGIPLYQPDRVDGPEVQDRIDEAEPDVVCVCAFGALIKEPLLSSHPMLNVHPSLLPRWRGAAPIERVIESGDELTGVSIMKLTAGLDSGPVHRRATEPIRDDDDYGSLSTRLQQLGAELLVAELDEPTEPAPQDETQVTYAEKISAEDRRLDPSLPAALLARRVRALTPHIGAYVELPDGSRLGVLEARAVRREPAERGHDPSAEALILDPPHPLLRTSDGHALELLVVQPPGRRPMPAADYLRGLRR